MAHQINPRWVTRLHPQDLKAQISELCRKGYKITYQDATTAQLVKRKSMSCLAALVSSLFFGIGLLIYVLVFWLVIGDDTVYLDLSTQ